MSIIAKSSKRIHQMTFSQWEKAFPSEEACQAYLAKHRWPNAVHCPRCGSIVIYPIATMAFKWQCYACAPNRGYRFSVTSGTFFEKTNKPLRQWFRVIHLTLIDKKKISSIHVHRMIGSGTPRIAWGMCRRVRASLTNDDFRKLMGIVDVDETRCR